MILNTSSHPNSKDIGIMPTENKPYIIIDITYI